MFSSSSASPRIRAQLLALHLRGGVPLWPLAAGLAVRAEEVPLGRLDSANLGGGGGDLLHHGGPHTGHLQRENRQHSAALHGRGSAGHGGEECGVSTPVPG